MIDALPVADRPRILPRIVQESQGMIILASDSDPGRRQAIFIVTWDWVVAFNANIERVDDE